MADGQPAGSGTEESSAAGSSSALLQWDLSPEADFPSTTTGHSDLQRSHRPQADLVTPSADPGPGHVTEVDQRQVTQPCGPLSARDLAQLAGDCQLEASTGHVTIQAPGTSGVVKGVEQHVYRAPVQHSHYHFYGVPPTRPALDAWRQGRAPQLPESSAQAALPPPASPPAGPRLALSETPPPPQTPGVSSQPAPPPAPAAVPQLPAAQPAAVTSPEPQSQAASQCSPAAEPQGGRPAVEETSQQLTSSSLASSQRPWSRPEAEAASGGQGRAWAAGQRPVTLPEESLKLKNLIANTRQLVATHCPQGYVDTAALHEMLEGLQQQGVCLVLGLPGHGKTALALQAMGRLAASHHLKPLRLDSPDQWRWLPGETEPDTTQVQQPQQQRRPPLTGERDPRDCSEDVSQRSRRYTVLVDDVFGKGNYNEARSESWGEILDLMLAKVRAGQVKLILVSRAHVFQACQVDLSKHNLFSEARTIDLRKPQYWTEEDNEDILEHFLSQHDVQITTPLEHIAEAAATCTEIAFPQCCQYFATNTDAQKEGCQFFRHPVSFLQRQLKSLQEKDPRSYLVLVLTWLGGDRLCEEEAADHAKLKAICRQFGVKEELTWTEIEAMARSLCGVYLREVEAGVFQLTHHSLHDCLVVAVCKADLKRALEVCSLEQMCEYVHTQGSSGGHAGLTYTVRRSQWPLLAARLVEAMTSEEVGYALGHPGLRDENFVSELVTKHLKPSQRLHLLKTKVRIYDLGHRIYTFLAAVLRLGYLDLSKSLLASAEMTEVPEEQSSTLLREALVSACSVGDGALVRHLLDRKAQVTEDALRAVGDCQKDDVDTLRALCHYRPSVKLTHDLYRDLLWRCGMRGKLQCVQFLLTEARPKNCQTELDCIINCLIQVTHPSKRRYVPANMEQTLSALKSAGANISKQEMNLWTAAGHPEPFVLKELLSDDTLQGKMYNENKQNLLHESARLGSLKCLQFLLQSPQTRCLDINALDYKKQSPLHKAVENNHLRVAEFLLQHGADPDGGVGLRGRSDVTHPRESCDAEDGNDATRTELHDSHVVCEGTAPLQLAARHHRLSLMELLITHKAKTDVLNKNLQTPLHEYANTTRKSEPEEEALRRRVESLIVEKTQNINHQDKNGATPLQLAAQNGLLSLVETLIGHKARTDVKDKQQRTALHAFASSTDNSWETKARKKTTACLVAATGAINQGDLEGLTPLHVAAEHDNLSTMEVLIEEGAKLDAVDRHQRSVLHAYLDRPCCCNVRLSGRRRRVEEALLASMPDLASADVEGRTAMHAAACCGHVSLMEKLMQRKCRVDVQDATGKTPLHCYAMSGGLENVENKRWTTLRQRVEELLFKASVEGGSGIDSQDNSRQTALHMAASSHHWTLMESLIRHGARVDVLDENGQTPVHCFAEHRYSSYWTTAENVKERVENLLVKTLSESGAINHQDKNGYSVLHLACGKGHWNLAESLLQHGARADLLDHYHRTPLHWKADQWYHLLLRPEQQQRVERLLVQKTPEEGQADINTQDTQGSTALHLAARNSNPSLLCLLMERHVRCDLTDKKNMSALHCFAQGSCRLHDKERLVQWLVESSDVTAKAKCGCTPLDMASPSDKETFLVRALKSRHEPQRNLNYSHFHHRETLPELEMKPVSRTTWSAALKYPQAVTVLCKNCWRSIERLRGQRDDRGASSAGHD